MGTSPCTLRALRRTSQSYTYRESTERVIIVIVFVDRRQSREERERPDQMRDERRDERKKGKILFNSSILIICRNCFGVNLFQWVKKVYLLNMFYDFDSWSFLETAVVLILKPILGVDGVEWSACVRREGNGIRTSPDVVHEICFKITENDEKIDKRWRYMERTSGTRCTWLTGLSRWRSRREIITKVLQEMTATDKKFVWLTPRRNPARWNTSDINIVWVAVVRDPFAPFASETHRGWWEGSRCDSIKRRETHLKQITLPISGVTIWVRVFVCTSINAGFDWGWTRYFANVVALRSLSEQ